MTVLCSFDVYGIPKPQGSHRAFVVNGHARMTDMSNTAGVQWRDQVANAAKTVADQILDSAIPRSCNTCGGTGKLTTQRYNLIKCAPCEGTGQIVHGPPAEHVPPFTGALSLEVVFRFPMPQSRPKWAKTAREQYKTTAPDCSKLVRSLEDALTAAGLIRDDALIAQLHAHKYEVWDMWTGATITIRRL